MLIFWKFLFAEDQIHYEKDPIHPVNNVSDIEPYSPKSTDTVICDVLGIFFICTWIISTSLNPLLFWYFRGIKRSSSAELKKYLAVTDFLTNVWAPLAYTYFMLLGDLVPLSHVVLRYVRTWTCIFGCFSQIIGFLLAVTRTSKIMFPFFNFKQRYVMIYLGCYFAYMILNNGAYFVVSEFFLNETWGIKLLKIGFELCFWANFTHCCAGLFISVFTVVYLYFTTRNSPGKKNAKYMTSCITILFINIPYFISVTGLVLVMWFLPPHVSLHEIIFAWVPIVTSTCNPIIILTRTSDVRVAVRAGVLRRPIHQGPSSSRN